MTDWTPLYSMPGHIAWIIAGLLIVLAGTVLLIIGETSWGGILMFIGIGWILLSLLGLKQGRK